MKRITIYCHNEDTEALRPLRERLEKKGALVRFQSVKYAEMSNTDQVLTLPKYLDRVKGIFAGSNIPVTPITDDVVETTDFRDPITHATHDGVFLTVSEAIEPEPVAEYVLTPALPLDLEPEPVAIVEPVEAPPEEPAPEVETPAVRRRRSSVKDEE